MEKRNVVEKDRTPKKELQTPDDQFEKDAASLFTAHDGPVTVSTVQCDKAKAKS
jgi:hypothetical protein